MKKKLSFLLVTGMAAVVLQGCNVGNFAEGPSPEDIKAKINAMTPEQQIAFYQGSPLSPTKKAAKIAEIKTKYGLK